MHFLRFSVSHFKKELNTMELQGHLVVMPLFILIYIKPLMQESLGKFGLRPKFI